MPRAAAKIGTRLRKTPARAGPTSSTPRMKKICASQDGNRAIYSVTSQPDGVGQSAVPFAIS